MVVAVVAVAVAIAGAIAVAVAVAIVGEGEGAVAGSTSYGSSISCSSNSCSCTTSSSSSGSNSSSTSNTTSITISIKTIISNSLRITGTQTHENTNSRISQPALSRPPRTSGRVITDTVFHICLSNVIETKGFAIISAAVSNYPYCLFRKLC